MSDPIGKLGSAFGGSGGIGSSGGIGGIGGIGSVDGPKKYTIDIGKGDGAKGGSFGDTLTAAINKVSDAQDASADLTARFLRGDSVELHQVMAASEEASISLEMMVELRNKFTDAYRTLINIQG